MISLSRLATSVAVTAAAIHGAPYLLSGLAYGSNELGALQRLAPAVFGIGKAGHLALTFDDGPHPEGTRHILDVLEAHGWKATFFMTASLVPEHPDVVMDVVARGHEIALHGWTHTSYMFKTYPQAKRELERGCKALFEITGVVPTWFRPPFGTLSMSAMVGAHAAGLKTVLWTAWGKDWGEEATADGIEATIRSGRLSGGTLLLHDGASPASPGNWKVAGEALDRLAGHFGNEQISVGPLAEHFA